MTMIPRAGLTQLINIILGIYFYEPDYNPIGSSGIKLLIKADIPLLQQLEIGKFFYNLFIFRKRMVDVN